MGHREAADVRIILVRRSWVSIPADGEFVQRVRLIQVRTAMLLLGISRMVESLARTR